VPGKSQMDKSHDSSLSSESSSLPGSGRPSRKRRVGLGSLRSPGT